MKIAKILLLGALMAQVVAPVRAMNAPVQDEGVLMGVAKDCAWAVGGIAKGLFNVGKYVWSYATPKRVEVLAAIGIGYAAYNRFFVLGGIESKYTKQIGGYDRISTFLAGQGSPVDIRLKILHVVNLMKEDRDLVPPHIKTQYAAEANAQQGQNINHYYGKKVAQHLVDRVNTEIREIDRDLQYLEDNYVSYFRLLNVVRTQEQQFSLVNDFEQACNGVVPENLTTHQFDGVAQAMSKATKNMLPLLTGRINYIKAAKLWWRLQQLKMRLRNVLVTQAGLINIAGGSAHFSQTNISSSVNASNNNHHVHVVNESPVGGPAVVHD